MTSCSDIKYVNKITTEDENQHIEKMITDTTDSPVKTMSGDYDKYQTYIHNAFKI